MADRQIRQLQAEIKGIRNSLLWRATQPIRVAAQRFPRMANWTSRLVRALCNFRQSVRQEKVDLKITSNDSWKVAEDLEAQVERHHKSSETRKRKIVLFTAIFGQYDKLLCQNKLSQM